MCHSPFFPPHFRYLIHIFFLLYLKGENEEKGRIIDLRRRSSSPFIIFKLFVNHSSWSRKRRRSTGWLVGVNYEEDTQKDNKNWLPSNVHFLVHRATALIIVVDGRHMTAGGEKQSNEAELQSEEPSKRRRILRFPDRSKTEQKRRMRERERN